MTMVLDSTAPSVSVTTNSTSLWSSSQNGSGKDGVQEKPLEEFHSIVLPLIYSIVCVVGLIGNSLVIWIVSKVRFQIRFPIF